MSAYINSGHIIHLVNFLIISKGIHEFSPTICFSNEQYLKLVNPTHINWSLLVHIDGAMLF